MNQKIFLSQEDGEETSGILHDEIWSTSENKRYVLSSTLLYFPNISTSFLCFFLHKNVICCVSMYFIMLFCYHINNNSNNTTNNEKQFSIATLLIVYLYLTIQIPMHTIPKLKKKLIKISKNTINLCHFPNKIQLSL